MHVRLYGRLHVCNLMTIAKSQFIKKMNYTISKAKEKGKGAVLRHRGCAVTDNGALVRGK